MKKFIEKIKYNKKYYYSTIVALLLLIGTTFAFVIAQVSSGEFKLFNLGADTTDQFELSVDKDISLTATQFNFTEGGENLSDTAVATARLKANSTKKEASYTYNVYLMIEKNEFKYTTEDKKTEILLQVTDPNDNNLTELDGLTYDAELQGFDITEDDGFISVTENYKIDSNSSSTFTLQNWNFKVVFINLETNQKDNAGKQLNGKIIIQKEQKFGDLTLNVNDETYHLNKNANVSCVGGSSYYDAKYDEVIITDFSKRMAICNLDYEVRTNKELLNEKIMSLAETTQGTGKLVHETFTNSSGALVDTGYRYEGKNPNNYVWFNNELWRIIGVFDESSHGQSGKNLVKLIRIDKVGWHAWDMKEGTNWKNSSLKSLLNGAYLNKENGTDDEYCYGYSLDTKGVCDYRIIGINSSYRKMISNVNWFINGYFTAETTNLMYEYERKNSLVDEGLIGLMYASDYGYSVLSESCDRSIKLGNYGVSSCAGQSWIYSGAEWTITKATNTSTNNRRALRIATEGATSGTGTVEGIWSYFDMVGVRPVLYLKENVFIINGDGSINNPFILGV